MDTNYSDCPTCGGEGTITYWRPDERLGGKEYLFGDFCPDCAARRRGTDHTGIPRQYANVLMETFDFGAYGQDMSKFRKAVTSFVTDFEKWGRMGLYLSSETPGSGKTFLACCIARTVMFDYDIQMRFITATDYLRAIGDGYNRQRGENDKTKVYRECALLVLDDLGAQKEGSWQDQEIFTLINKRIVEGLPTIITSNEKQENLNLNDRTIDRIISYTLPLQMPEISIRRKDAKTKQDSIIKRILGDDA